MQQNPGKAGLSPQQRRATLALASIFSLRMLGLFMILPVFTLYAEGYTGYTPALAGLAIGAYGLTQALFQIPFGMLSDRIGRRPVITVGLLIFALGSALAALSSSMVGVICGRALQGTGAIAAAVLALTADLTREEQRIKAMAAIGASIGLSFALALILGPLLTRWVGLDGLFWTSGLLALAGIGVLHWFIPRHVAVRFHRDTEPVVGQFLQVLRHQELLRLDAGIFVLHALLTAGFVAIPLLLRDYGKVATAHHWQIYLLVMVGSLVMMVPFLLISKRFQRIKQVFLGAIVTLGVAQLALLYGQGSLLHILLGMFLFFTAFNVLEATLPALVSQMAPPDKKGTALGVYTTCQFSGAFLGGVLGGWLYGSLGGAAVFGFCAAATAGWLGLAIGMHPPAALSNRLLRVGKISTVQASELAARLTLIGGVAEAVVCAEDGIAYLKVNQNLLDEEALQVFSTPEAG
jgi:MFS family permease